MENPHTMHDDMEMLLAEVDSLAGTIQRIAEASGFHGPPGDVAGLLAHIQSLRPETH